MHVHMAAYGQKYPYMYYFGAWEVLKTFFHNIFTPKKLVGATPSCHSYGAAPPNFPAEHCSTNPATLICG